LCVLRKARKTTGTEPSDPWRVERADGRGKDGGLEWSKVTAIRILGVEDTHE